MTSRIRVVLALVVGIAIGAGGYALISQRSQVHPIDSANAPATQPEASVQPSVASEAPDSKTAPLPEIPISLNYVEAPSGNGYVVQFHNQSQKHLAVLVELENTTLDQRRSGPLQLAPGQLVSIGGTRDWTFVSGETVTIKLDGYQTKSFQVP